MRLAFLGTPDAATPTLRALVAAGHDVALVVTRPDRRRRRGGVPEASAVKVAARELGLAVTDELRDVDAVGVSRGVVVAYGALVPGPMLERVPMLNGHFSLLPRWRGAAPVARALLAGDEVTGVSVMSLEASLDTGPVHLVREVTVGEKGAAALTAELADVAASALVEVLASASLLEHPTPQVGEATYAEKLTSEDRRLRVTVTGDVAERVVRVGGAYCTVDARRLIVERARLSDEVVVPGTIEWRDDRVLCGFTLGTLEFERVRPAGARSMSGAEWWRGRRSSERTWS